MSVVNALKEELFSGISAGRREAIDEAPTLTNVAGLKNPNYADLKKPINVYPMPGNVLGHTDINPDGKVNYVAINSKIPYIVEKAMQVYNKSLDWAKKTVYKISKLTTEHELAHVQSSNVVKGEEYNTNTVDVMESVTTYAKHKTAKALGKHEKAKLIEQTNPYPKAWLMGKIADWAPYKSITGKEGYAAFMEDVQKEPFYKPVWRLTKAATKSAVAKGKDYMKEMGLKPSVQAA